MIEDLLDEYNDAMMIYKKYEKIIDKLKIDIKKSVNSDKQEVISKKGVKFVIQTLRYKRKSLSEDKLKKYISDDVIQNCYEEKDIESFKISQTL